MSSAPNELEFKREVCSRCVKVMPPLPDQRMHMIAGVYAILRIIGALLELLKRDCRRRGAGIAARQRRCFSKTFWNSCSARGLNQYNPRASHPPKWFLGHCIYAGCAVIESFLSCRCQMQDEALHERLKTVASQQPLRCVLSTATRIFREPQMYGHCRPILQVRESMPGENRE